MLISPMNVPFSGVVISWSWGIMEIGIALLSLLGIAFLVNIFDDDDDDNEVVTPSAEEPPVGQEQIEGLVLEGT